MIEMTPNFDVDAEQLVTRLFDLSGTGDPGNTELAQLDSMVYTRMAEFYGVDASHALGNYS